MSMINILESSTKIGKRVDSDAKPVDFETIPASEFIRGRHASDHVHARGNG